MYFIDILASCEVLSALTAAVPNVFEGGSYIWRYYGAEPQNI